MSFHTTHAVVYKHEEKQCRSQMLLHLTLISDMLYFSS